MGRKQHPELKKKTGYTMIDQILGPCEDQPNLGFLGPTGLDDWVIGAYLRLHNSNHLAGTADALC